MELVYSIQSPEGGACALVASYAYTPGAITISSLGKNATKAAGQTLRLYTPDGEFDEAATIIKYLCDKSEARSVLLGPDKNPAAQAAIAQWVAFCASRGFQIYSGSDLSGINSSLNLTTFLCGHSISVADLVVMASLHSFMEKAHVKELLANKNVTRWFNHMQNLPGIEEQRVQGFPYIELPTSSPADVVKAVEEAQKRRQQKQQKQQADPQQQPQQQQQQRQQQQQQQQQSAKPSEKRTDDAAAGKKDAAAKRKTKSAEAPPAAAAAAAAEERPIDDPMRLELRVGLVKKVWRHPEADKLYCEEIDFGSFGVRQIASGLVPFLPADKFENEKVVVLFNLKAKPLRGFVSHGMVMCANSEDKTQVELLLPPKDAPLGERVVVKGMEGAADEVLSSKKGKDPLAAVSPFLKTKDDCVAYYKDLPLVTPQGPVRCISVKGGYIS